MLFGVSACEHRHCDILRVLTELSGRRDPFAAHHEHMRQVMRSFSEPLGRDPFLSLPEGRPAAAPGRAEGRARQDLRVAPRGPGRVSDPLSSGDIPGGGKRAGPALGTSWSCCIAQGWFLSWFLISAEHLSGLITGCVLLIIEQH